MEKKPSIDPGFLAPIALGVLSIVGIIVIFFLGRANASRPAGEIVSTETPFRYIYLGTEPGLSTLTPEPTETPIFIEPFVTDAPDSSESPFLTSAPTAIELPTRPSSIRTPTITPTIPAVFLKVDDTYFELLYDGDWVAQSNVTGADENTLHISFKVGNSVSFTFVGQQVIVVYQAGPSLGSILINFDGLDLPPVVQTNGETKRVEWVSPVLVKGTHVITIEHLSGGSVNLDSITIPDLSTPTPTVTP